MSEWVVVYTKPNFEKKIVEKLSVLGVENYLPIQRVRVQRSDRKVWVNKVLFKSYIFIKKSHFLAHRENIIRIDGYLKLITNNQKPVTVKQLEIDNIKLLIDNNFKLDISHQTPEVGSTIYIDKLKIEGVVQRIKANKSIQVYIPSLNAYLSLSLL